MNLARNSLTFTSEVKDPSMITRRGVADLVDPDLATSPLITGGDPDSDSNKYKRRAPTDLLFR